MAKVAPKNLVPYRKHYNEDSFWKKLAKVAGKAGEKLVYLALILYYELMDPNISMKDKGIIIGALGYFILPLDLLPDFIPAVGFADDLSAVIAAYKTIKNNITPEVEENAKRKLTEWFGKVDDSALEIGVEDENEKIDEQL